ncbi:MAG: response regulator [Eubacterium sp.]|nr:response regulator [Eubacterium sp.]
MGMIDIRKEIQNLRNKKSGDFEFTGLYDRDVEIEKNLNLYTAEGQFYVLVVDADYDERISLERMIDQTGCYVSSVASGIECMMEVSKDKYDLVIVARTMPRMDGIQTLKNMKESPSSKCRDSKVYIILDEKVDEPDIYFQSIGFEGIIRKPIDRTIIQNIIVKHAPKKMLPDDAVMLSELKTNAEDAEKLKSCGIRYIEALKGYDGEVDGYKYDATTFCDDYEVVVSDMMDALYSGKNNEYMELARNMREKARNIGAIHLSYCFDDHVNMAKDDTLDVAETNWRSLVVEWENVVVGLAAWLGKTSVQVGSTTEVLTSNTNGIKLSENEVKERIDEILGLLEDNKKDQALSCVYKLFVYELDLDTKLKIDRVLKAFTNDKINTAVDILKSI